MPDLVHLLRNIKGYLRDTKANIEASTDPDGLGWFGYATDTDEFGVYNGASWTWFSAGSGTFPNPFALPADITPAAITGQVNDYEPTGGATADVWRLSTNGAARTITGIAGGADGRILILHNIDADWEFTLSNEAGVSSAANRFDFGGHNIYLNPGSLIALIYDATLSRWKVYASHDAEHLHGVAIDPDLGSMFGHLFRDDDGIIKARAMFDDSEGAPASIGTAADGTSVYAARRDHVHDTKNGEGVLGSTFSITGSDGVYQDTGLSITLPEAGTYLIVGTIRGIINATTNGANIVAKLYNSTDAADVANTETLVIYANTNGVTWQNSVSMTALVTVAAGKTIKLYAFRTGGGTYSISQIASAAGGRTRLQYLKVG